MVDNVSKRTILTDVSSGHRLRPHTDGGGTISLSFDHTPCECDPSGAAQGASALLAAWYADHGRDRGLPWRRPHEAHARRALVEGLLGQTRADAVAALYEKIFAGMYTAADWVCCVRRRERLAPLGFADAKLAATDSIAACLLARQCTAADLGVMRGVGPYIAGMVAVLHGHPAAPVDCNVARVAARCGADDPQAWIGKLVDAAAPGERYAVVSAVLDIGAVRCTADGVDCERCPMDTWCQHPQKRHQLILFSG